MNHISFSLNGNENIALCDLLKLTSLANSGGQAKMLIADGQVLRNGVVETRKTAKIRAGEKIEFNQYIISVE
ncbi:MAG: RNA-binding S4 domain-containing protein [Neisseriaceae bacterium]|nr:RNA-binding S4 domain-containing protein [Neisseriaceae bacterium]MBQ5429869.1 RNA-binding S4 domain-containing protein [Neisseriaceae bacterium]